ncbi:MAG: co-chaperone GroES [Calditrichia bacterium]
MKIKPIDDRVLVELYEEEEERVGHIIIPDTAKEKPRMGKIIAVGTDEDIRELFKEGDKILFAKYGGDEIKLDGKEYIILQRSDILAIVE